MRKKGSFAFTMDESDVRRDSMIGSKYMSLAANSAYVDNMLMQMQMQTQQKYNSTEYFSSVGRRSSATRDTNAPPE